MKPQSNERTYKDPVCGMEVSRLTAIEELEYKGKTYYFCAKVGLPRGIRDGTREVHSASPPAWDEVKASLYLMFVRH